MILQSLHLLLHDRFSLPSDQALEPFDTRLVGGHLGLQVGQHIDWPAPGGKTLKLELLSVEGQPKDGGAFTL